MAQYTTSTTTHEITKYSSSKTPVSAQVGVGEIQWKNHTSEQLRLTLSVTTVSTPTHGTTSRQPLARYIMKISYLSDEPPETQHASQHTPSEVVFENLDLTSFSEIKYQGRELPLKAVYRNCTVGFRYLYPQIQSPVAIQTYRRFQVTFKSEAAVLDFIGLIQAICPCNASPNPQPPASQVASGPPASAPDLQRRATTTVAQGSASSVIHPPFPKKANVPRKSVVFNDPLSYSSLNDRAGSLVGGASSTQPALDTILVPKPLSHAVFGSTTNDQTKEGTSHRAGDIARDRMDVDNTLSSSQTFMSTVGSDDNRSHLSVPSSSAPSAPSPFPSQSIPTPGIISATREENGPRVPRDTPPVQQVRGFDGASMAETEGNCLRHSPILSALRQGDSEIYSLSFEELHKLVAEVIREPGFPELVGRVQNMWKEQALVDLQLASSRQRE